MSIRLPPTMRFIERDWLSANQIVFLDGGHAASVIDTGYVKHEMLTCALVERVLGGRTLTRIINTHLHSDHCGGNRALARKYGCEVLVPLGSYAAAAVWSDDRLSFAATGQRCARFVPTGSIKAGDHLSLGGFGWEVHAAPGHDPESVLLYSDAYRVLISADALWEDGFGVTFPELSGESGFREQHDVLELIERLDPLVVIPGHGPMFTEVDLALARARGRLAWLREDPARNARYALKVLVKFLMLDLERASEDDIVARLATTALLRDTSAQLDIAVEDALRWALQSLVKANALEFSEGVFCCPGLSAAPS